MVDTEVTLVDDARKHPTEVEPGLDTLIGLAVPLLLGDVLGDSSTCRRFQWNCCRSGPAPKATGLRCTSTG